MKDWRQMNKKRGILIDAPLVVCRVWWGRRGGEELEYRPRCIILSRNSIPSSHYYLRAGVIILLSLLSNDEAKRNDTTNFFFYHLLSSLLFFISPQIRKCASKNIVFRSLFFQSRNFSCHRHVSLKPSLIRYLKVGIKSLLLMLNF